MKGLSHLELAGQSLEVTAAASAGRPPALSLGPPVVCMIAACQQSRYQKFAKHWGGQLTKENAR